MIFSMPQARFKLKNNFREIFDFILLYFPIVLEATYIPSLSSEFEKSPKTLHQIYRW